MPASFAKENPDLLSPNLFIIAQYIIKIAV